VFVYYDFNVLNLNLQNLSGKTVIRQKNSKKSSFFPVLSQFFWANSHPVVYLAPISTIDQKNNPDQYKEVNFFLDFGLDR
jgi:hypothetical protein